MKKRTSCQAHWKLLKDDREALKVDENVLDGDKKRKLRERGGKGWHKYIKGWRTDVLKRRKCDVNDDEESLKGIGELSNRTGRH